MTEETYTGIFSPGDRVIVAADNFDGSWEGSLGVVVATRFQKGGTFAPSRNYELVLLDDEDNGEFDVNTEEGRAALLAKYDETGDPWLADSDEYEFEESA